MPDNIQSLAPLVVANAYVAAPAADPLTDDHAPVDWLTRLSSSVPGPGTCPTRRLGRSRCACRGVLIDDHQ
jgi:hypothetical protein